MLDGTYGIQMRTPMGPKEGMLLLQTQGNLVSGVLEVLGNANPFTNGRVEGDSCRFSGQIKTALDSVAYEAEGRVDGDTLTAVSRTIKGDMKITGTRIR